MRLYAFVIGLFVSLSAIAETNTFVLVHGALFTSDGWSRLESALQSAGQNVVSLNVPGRAGDGVEPKTVGLRLAAGKVCKVARATQQQVILVGHSQGGALITQAIAICPESIKSLVYVTAIVPLNGEGVFQKLSETTVSNFLSCATPDPENGVFRLKDDKAHIEATFFADVRALDPKLVDLTLASMVDEPMGIGSSVLEFPQDVFDRLPKFYVKTELDKTVIPADQDMYISRVNMTKVFSMNTSHSPFLSQPNELAKNLLEAAELSK